MIYNLKEIGGAVTFDVKVTPGSSKNEITGVKDGVLKVKITAAPDRGKANRELAGFLSEFFEVKKPAVTIIKGDKSRNKSIRISGMTKKDFETKCGGVM
jgi:uncharacterized protein (TIGR00251 family)